MSVAGVLMLLDRGGVSVALDQNSVFPFGGTTARLLTAIALCAGFVVGRRGGTHLHRSSRGAPQLPSPRNHRHAPTGRRAAG